jgi:hypothetical protein
MEVRRLAAVNLGREPQREAAALAPAPPRSFFGEPPSLTKGQQNQPLMVNALLSVVVYFRFL